MDYKPSGTIICFGSLIMDISIQCGKLPAIGETVYTYEDYRINPGGKGGNQAVAAARSGGNVTLIGRIAGDEYGQQLIDAFQEDRIHTQALITDRHSKTGVAFVWVDKDGHNSCVCSLGVNAKVTCEDLSVWESLFTEGSIVMTTLEHSDDILDKITRMAKEHGCTLIVDPSSKDYSKLTPVIARRIDILKPNEIETEILTGVTVRNKKDAAKAIGVLKEKGIRMPIISMGEQGAVYEDNGKLVSIDGIKVRTVDTTAAGDTFIGSMAAKLSQGDSLYSSVIYANKAAAFCVQRRGAQISIPFEENVL